MQLTANYLRHTLDELLPLLKKIGEKEASQKTIPNKWSKKEIIGHLIDSACNNQQKFVRSMAASHTDFVGYAQDFWVEKQAYQKRRWRDLLTLWTAYNMQIAHIIEHCPDDLLSNTISIEGAGPFTLRFIMEDYVEHLKHHLRQALPEAEIMSTFSNVYGD